MIGAMELSNNFYTLEKLGNENNQDKILEYTPSVLADLRALKPYLAPYSVQTLTPEKDFDKEKVTAILKNLSDSINGYDLTRAESCVAEIASYKFNNELTPLVKRLCDLVANLDYNDAAELSKRILGML